MPHMLRTVVSKIWAGLGSDEDKEQQRRMCCGGWRTRVGGTCMGWKGVVVSFDRRYRT